VLISPPIVASINRLVLKILFLRLQKSLFFRHTAVTRNQCESLERAAWHVQAERS